MLPIIEVKNLSKEYIISHNIQPYYTLRDSLVNFVKSLFFSVRGGSALGGEYFSSLCHSREGGNPDSTKILPQKKEKFMALNDINFSVMPGEAIGIIGRNGAGKSTLLKVLSQITPPTKGSIHLRGRVASLLEVGTGFHPELTGRENIFLNGAILGMTQKEIKNKFNEIVEFAGIEKFLDTPVKRYSSGMYVRLAFAVAAHLEPEILIVDEVLAVGDAEFQKKCLGKMGDITKKDGRTVLFVSHNMEAIKNLCTRCILLDNGRKVFEGETEKTLLAYNNLQSNSNRELRINKGEYNANRRGSGTLSFTNIEILDSDNKKRNAFNIGETVRFKMSYAVYSEIKELHVSIGFFSNMYKDLLLTDMSHEVKSCILKKGETGTFIIEVELTSIRSGEYILYFSLRDKKATVRSRANNYDIVDDMTEPLIIKVKNEEAIVGSFSLPSRIIRL